MVIALGSCVNQTNSMNTTNKSTYALLVRSEEKERGLLEIVVYSLFILSAVAAIVQFASQPVKLMVDPVRTTTSAAHVEVVNRA